jgi:hypothetical protein
MKRNELLKLLREGYTHFTFLDLPQQHLDTEVLSVWLQKGGFFNAIPKKFVNDELRRFAVSLYLSNRPGRDYPLRTIQREDTQCYEELVFLALKQSHKSMVHVDPSLYDEAFFLKALEINADSLLCFGGDYLYPVASIDWSEAMIDAAVSKNPEYIQFFKPDQIKKESLVRLVTGGEIVATELAKAGLFGLMSELMRDTDYWPQLIDKPASLDECFDLFEEADYSSMENLAVCCKAFIRQYPMETVLPLMISASHQSLITKIYTSDELIPHIRTGMLKGAGKIRGKLLEEGLGL